MPATEVQVIEEFISIFEANTSRYNATPVPPSNAWELLRKVCGYGQVIAPESQLSPFDPLLEALHGRPDWQAALFNALGPMTIEMLDILMRLKRKECLYLYEVRYLYAECLERIRLGKHGYLRSRRSCKAIMGPIVKNGRIGNLHS